MTVKTQGVTGEDRGFSYGQGFLEPVVLLIMLYMIDLKTLHNLNNQYKVFFVIFFLL